MTRSRRWPWSFRATRPRSPWSGSIPLFISEEATAGAREAITAATKIPGSHILIGASHTHGGGPVATCFGSEADPEYVDLVVKRVAEAVISAYHSLHAAELGDGIGHEPSISFNRRFLMRDGRQVTHPGKGNPDIVRPSGPIDPDVGVLAARAPGGELLGTVCQLRLPSRPSWAGTASRRTMFTTCARRCAGITRSPRLPVGFLLGAAGDVTQVDNLRPGREFGEEWSSLFGLALGAEVIQTVGRLTWQNGCRDPGRPDRMCPFRSASRARCRTRSRRAALAPGAEVDKIYAREREMVEKERAKRPVIPCEVQAIRIGDLGIVTNGAEFFCQLGLDIKEASPLDRTWVVSLANQWIGYVATPSAYYAGGYEPRTARSAKMAPWAGQALVEGSLAALKSVKQNDE